MPAMRISGRVLPVLLASFVLSGGSLAAQRPTADADRAVRAVITAVFSAQERGDMAALDTLYAGEALTIFEGAGVNRGWADYRDHHLGPELKEMKEFRYRPIEIDVHVDGATAWATVSYALQAKMGDRAVDNFGRGTVILERKGSGTTGRWVVRHSHTASRARRASDPPMPGA
ncbi:MAG: nuclear transport factor 2 family protein [Gemmatimonadaceae bacterium]|uniref:nuclear transport factor 2 family protein n=1 Tax=Gemmatimonas sp. UBA7669 TaxID=1946568 RepID=UPI0025BCF02E|nr:nuclear transport factor 2 family protein [Gemmatimonas sp. UBA7669]MBX9856416.1 nuclear transport factor 2 family protein [Gemmatimonadaceae bacterium]